MRASFLFLSALMILAGARAPLTAQSAPAATETPATNDPRESVCLMIESAATANALPLDFFARVIWQESRFQPDVVGPTTRSGQRAEGIAQFMPGTAAERRLLDPFNPVEALPKSAEFLAALRREFGNLGLAAAAYNAGAQRVRDFLSGARALPAETRNYVQAITGHPIESWTKPAEKARRERQPADARSAPPDDASTTTCRDLMALLKRAPNAFVAGLEQHIDLVAASPWGVQLSAGFSRDRVLASYASLAKRFDAILSGHDPSIFKGVLRSRGTQPFYQVRIGAPTRGDADALCGKIMRAGGACFVLRNTDRAG